MHANGKIESPAMNLFLDAGLLQELALQKGTPYLSALGKKKKKKNPNTGYWHYHYVPVPTSHRANFTPHTHQVFKQTKHNPGDIFHKGNV